MMMTRSAFARSFASLLFLISMQQGKAQEARDSTVRTPKTEELDSVRTQIIPIALVGSVDRTPDSVIPDSARNLSDYTYTGDLFSSLPGVYTFDLASPGQLNGFTIHGLGHASIAFLSDGIPLNEPLTGSYNLFLYPIEQAERVEIISGTRAFYYGLNSNTAALNFVSKSPRAIHPRTNIRYIQAPYDHTFFDGSFSQDVLRGMNVMLGLFHRTNKGRFPNADYADWSARLKLRYDINNKLSLFASGMYVTTNLGLNGGVNIEETLPDYRYNANSEYLVMVNTDSYEKIDRYDTQIGAAAQFLGDTVSTTTVTFYHSTSFREYRDEENRPSPNGRYVREDTRTQWYGVKLNQHFESGTTLFDLGFQVERRGVIASDLFPQYLRNLTSAFGKLELHPVKMLTGIAVGRFDNFLGNSLFSFGLDLSLRLTEGLELTAGGSKSHRFPTIQELQLPDTSFQMYGPPAGVERHTYYEGGMIVHTGNVHVAARYFHRVIAGFNIITPVSSGGPESPTSLTKELNGIDGTLTLRLGVVRAEISGQYLHSKRLASEIIPPEWSAAGGLYFADKIIGGHLDLKTGVRARIFSSTKAVEYNPQAQVYYGGAAPDIAGARALDAILIGHLGTAYVHFVMENIFDTQYVTTTFYPMNERLFRFGVSWNFLD